jgi:hypothetical protein
MDLQWADASMKMVMVTLDEGEALGSLTGPTTGFIPADSDNKDFAAIVAGGYSINEAEASS